MMRFELPYGKSSHLSIEIPDDTTAIEVHPKTTDALEIGAVLRDALASPLKSSPLAEFLRGAKKILFIVNDGTRPTPTARLLDFLPEVVENDRIEFLVATGAHRGPTEEEFRFVFGAAFDRIRTRVHAHDAKKKEELVHFGQVSTGNEIQLNHLVQQADRLVLVSSVEPHYFGGFTGGRKSILPGVAGYDTIERNHRQALDPRARALALDDNPVNIEMEETIRLLGDKPIFSIQTVLDGSQQVCAAFTGELDATFRRAVEKSLEIFSVEVEQLADIVITCAPFPMDIDLYQSQKALENGKLILKPDGILILVSQCWDGIGPKNFYNLLAGAKTYDAVFEIIRSGYKLGYHKAAKLIEPLLQGAEIWVKSDLEDSVVSRIFLRPVSDLQVALDEALKRKGRKAVVALLADGSVTVPRLRGT
ncbi:MAG: nickel-dependent lactate racemase [Planctomycetota bacterium]